MISIFIIYFRFNWGSRMLKLSEQILKLLQDEEALIEARLKALKITNEIQGFGSSFNSPTSSSSSSSSPWSLSSEASQGSSSFYSFSTTSTPAYTFDSNDQLNKHHSPTSIANDGNINIVLPPKNINVTKNHVWKRFAGEENNILIDSDEDEDMEKPKGLLSEICSKIIGGSPIKGDNRENIEFRCLSDVGSKVTQKKLDRRYSIWF